MERYIQRNWLRNLKTRISDNGGNPNSGDEISKEVNTDRDVRPSRLVQMIAGLVGLGLAMSGIGIILGDIIDSAEFNAFLPLILSGGIYAFYMLKHKESDAFREIASGVLFVSFYSAFPDVLRVLEIDLGEPSYPQIVGLAVGGFLMFFNKSSLTAGLLMIVLIGTTVGGLASGLIQGMFGGRGGVESMELVDMIIYWLIFAAVIKFFMDQNEDSGVVNLKTVLLGWLVAATLLSLSLAASGGQVFLGLGGSVLALYVFGKKYFGTGAAFYSRPFQTIAIVISGLALTYCSIAGNIPGLLLSSGVFTEFKGPQLVGLLFTLGLLGGSGFYYFKNNWETGNKLNIFMLAFPALTLLSFLGAFAESEDVFELLAVLFWASGLALFGNYIRTGLKSKYPPALLLGLYFVIQLVLVKYNSVGSLEPMQKGIMNLLFGAAILYLVKMIDDVWNLGNFTGMIPDIPAVNEKMGASSGEKPIAPAASTPNTESNNDSNDSSGNDANDSDSANDEPKTES